jgi:hypothetical protein
MAFPSHWNNQASFRTVDEVIASAPGTVNDTLVINQKSDNKLYKDLPVSSMWFIPPNVAGNGYWAAGYLPFGKLTCESYPGYMCSEALDNLFQLESSTGESFIDLLQIDSLIVVKGDSLLETACSPRQGWSIVTETETYCVWERVVPVGPAGGVSWTGAGTKVSELEVENNEVSFRVDSVGDDNRVVLSRLNWPGYESTSGVVSSTAEIFVTIDLPQEAVGKRVTVSFTPPGWKLGIPM